jgi:hypothetical protein
MALVIGIGGCVLKEAATRYEFLQHVLQLFSALTPLAAAQHLGAPYGFYPRHRPGGAQARARSVPALAS